jgi:hypothetical protein
MQPDEALAFDVGEIALDGVRRADTDEASTAPLGPDGVDPDVTRIAPTPEVALSPRSSTGSKTSAYPLLTKLCVGVFRKPSPSRPAWSAESTVVAPTAVPTPPSTRRETR